MTELSIAVLIVGFLIWIMGLISPKEGPPHDILGFGLMGNSGLAIYAAGVAAVCGLGYGIYRLVRPSGPWGEVAGHLLRQTPVIGKALEVVSLARMSTVLGLTLNTSMDVFRALALGIRSSGDATAGGRAARRRGRRDGRPLGSRCPGGRRRLSQRIPGDGRRGRAVRQPGGVVRQTRPALPGRGELRLSLLARAASFLVWLAVAAMIIFAIFCIVHSYLDMLAGAAKM